MTIRHSLCILCCVVTLVKFRHESQAKPLLHARRQTIMAVRCLAHGLIESLKATRGECGSHGSLVLVQHVGLQSDSSCDESEGG